MSFWILPQVLQSSDRRVKVNWAPRSDMMYLSTPPPGKDLFLENFDYFLRLAISEREHLYPFCVVIHYEEISILTERERTHQIHPNVCPGSVTCVFCRKPLGLVLSCLYC